MDDEAAEGDTNAHLLQNLGPNLLSITEDTPINDNVDASSLLNENALLRSKVAKLKRRLKRFCPPKETQSEALCTIAYHNIARKSIPLIEDLLKTSPLGDEENRCGSAEAKRKTFIVHYFRTDQSDAFQIDTIPSADLVEDERDSSPSYDRGPWEDIPPLGAQPIDQDPNTSEEQCCFNCGEPGHPFNECPLPPDKERIQQNRTAFMNSRPEKFTGRYATSQAVLYSRFRPGVLSTQLKEALDIGDTDHPPYYSRMKIYGYPPGYIGYRSKSEASKFAFPVEDEISLTSRIAKGEPYKMAEYPGLDAPMRPRSQWRLPNPGEEVHTDSESQPRSETQQAPQTIYNPFDPTLPTSYLHYTTTTTTTPSYDHYQATLPQQHYQYQQQPQEQALSNYQAANTVDPSMPRVPTTYTPHNSQTHVHTQSPNQPPGSNLYPPDTWSVQYQNTYPPEPPPLPPALPPAPPPLPPSTLKRKEPETSNIEKMDILEEEDMDIMEEEDMIISGPQKKKFRAQENHDSNIIGNETEEQQHSIVIENIVTEVVGENARKEGEGEGEEEELSRKRRERAARWKSMHNT